MNPDDLYSKGMNLLEERKFQNALSHFEQALNVISATESVSMLEVR